MLCFGVVVDTKNVDKKVYKERGVPRKEVSSYDIIGLSLLDIENNTVNIKIHDIEDYEFEYSEIGGTLDVERYYGSKGNLLHSVYSIYTAYDIEATEISSCLPVYSEKGKLLFSCNGSKFMCKCGMGLGLVVDITSLDVNLERYNNISNEIHENMLFVDRAVPLSEISCLLDTSIENISHTNDLYYIHDSISEFILPKCCKTLMLASAIDIDKLVLNAELRTIEIPSTVNLNTLYISKGINEEVMCHIIYYFVSKYMFETSNITDTKYRKLFDSIGTLLKNYEYHKLWDWCYRSKDGKKLLSDAIKDANIVIY